MEAATTPHKVHPDLGDLLVPIGELKEHPRNPRIGNVDAIAESLDQNQQLKPIIAKSDGTVVAGNHTLKAARKLGWTHVAALLLNMTEDQEQRYLLADNRVADLAQYDLEVLQPMLVEMQEAGQLQGTGFTADDVDDLTAEMGRVADASGGEGADHVEPEDRTKERYPSAANEGGAPGVPMKEVTLSYPTDQFDAVAGHVNELKKRWGVDATRDVVAEALKREVERGDA